MIEEGLVFRLYPTEEQAHLLNKTFGACRFVHNYALAEREQYYDVYGHSLPCAYNTQARELTLLREYNPWLAEVSSIALQQELRFVDTAYTNFFKHGAGHPKFVSKKNRNQSFKIVNPAKTLIKDGRIRIPSVGWVKIVQTQSLEGKVSSFVVRRTPSGKYFVSILCVDVEKKSLPKTEKCVAIDLGVKNLATFSDGIIVENPKNLIKAQRKLAHEQRKLSRKSIGSANWEKQRVRIARLFETVSNRRKDFSQKFTTDVVRKYDEIIIEDLDVKEMMMNAPRELAKRIADANFGEIVRELEYKCEWYGKTLIKRDRYFPSSQMCSNCGYINKEVKNLSVREWECPNCHTVHDRDFNASINLLHGAPPLDCRGSKPLEGLGYQPDEEGILHA